MCECSMGPSLFLFEWSLNCFFIEYNCILSTRPLALCPWALVGNGQALTIYLCSRDLLFQPSQLYQDQKDIKWDTIEVVKSNQVSRLGCFNGQGTTSFLWAYYIALVCQRHHGQFFHKCFLSLLKRRCQSKLQ